MANYAIVGNGDRPLGRSSWTGDLNHTPSPQRQAPVNRCDQRRASRGRLRMLWGQLRGLRGGDA
jgi:hypothetical protein